MKKPNISQLIDLLKKTYPDAHCELNFTNPLELLIATILSAQCTDVRVNMVTAELFKKYRTLKDYAEADVQELDKDVKSINFHLNKTKNIIKCCQQIIQDFGGKIPQNMADLVTLAGVGRKTANVVLGNAFDINVGVVVDTHVKRLSNRLGLTKHEDPVKIEEDLIKLVPNKDWTLFSHLLIWHGRRRCSARKPDCHHCELAKICPSYPLS